MLKLRLRYFTSALQKRKHTHYWRAILYDMFYILPYCSSFVRYVVCISTFIDLILIIDIIILYHRYKDIPAPLSVTTRARRLPADIISRFCQ